MVTIGASTLIFLIGLIQCGDHSQLTGLLLVITPSVFGSTLVSGTGTVKGSILWAGENNWVVPPANQVIKAWKHFQICRARGVLIVPLWRGSTFWPSICPDGTHLAKCVTAWAGIPEWNHPATLP